MGLREFLARRAQERRIKRRGKKLFEETKKDNIPQSIRRIGEKGVKAGRRLYLETQKRKGEGKEELKRQARKLLGVTKREARLLLKGTTEKKRRQKK